MGTKDPKEEAYQTHLRNKARAEARRKAVRKVVEDHLDEVRIELYRVLREDYGNLFSEEEAIESTERFRVG